MQKRTTMRKSRFTETQIVKILKEVEGGRQVKGVCTESGVSEATYYNWETKYGGIKHPAPQGDGR
jgi:putative transposase